MLLLLLPSAADSRCAGDPLEGLPVRPRPGRAAAESQAHIRVQLIGNCGSLIRFGLLQGVTLVELVGLGRGDNVS